MGMLILFTVIIAILLVIFFQGYSRATEKYENTINELKKQIQEFEDKAATYTVATTEIVLDVIKSEIKNIGELATIEYLYTNAGKFEDPKKLFGITIPFTTKSFIAKWDGIIKAGINVEEIDVEINDLKKEIVVYMPAAKILSHEIDADSIETLDERDGLFNALKVEDVREFDAVSKEVMEKRAIENGILEKAYENARGIIEKLINNEVVQKKGYTIRFDSLIASK